MTTPLVSVIMPTYNHARYVGPAITSVLAQQGVSFEFLIEDDGSKDDTRDEVLKVRDARIHFTPRDFNLGAAVTTNNLIARAKGEFVALINSDDVWCRTDKLALQVGVLRSRPNVGACFGRANFIAADGQPYGEEASIFAQPNRSRALWLRRFFLEGNCLCHPTVLIRRSIYERLGVYDNRLRQVPDFDLWIRVAKHHEFHVMDQELISFRLTGDGNTSASTPVNDSRLMNEYVFLLRDFFESVDEATLREGFGDLLLNQNITTAAQLEVEKVLLYFKVEHFLGPVCRTLGLEKVHGLLARPEYRPVLAEYGIDDLWFHQQMGVYSPFMPWTSRQAPAPDVDAAPPSRQQRKPLLRYLSFLRR